MACPTTLMHNFAPCRTTSGSTGAAIAADLQPVPHIGKNPFMRMRHVWVTYAVGKYVTFRTFNVLNILAAVQWGRQVNLMI